ncbi:MAG: hypothetical protein MRERV_49c003 [Mycoplasmataceae bacterium RV_VA103A]|nr:MAG: hypothetical protein MRERV_49c003 [Mycoplasmataceae bacterium RV_VA103A]
MPNLKLCFNLKLNPTDEAGELKKTRWTKQETLKKGRRRQQGVGDVGWLVDCEIAEFFKLANLVSTTKYPFPLGLVWPWVHVKKNLLEHE